MTSTLRARTSLRRRCRAGRSVLPPEKPPSSYLALSRVQPAWAWLRIYACEASYWASSELKSCSSPWSVDTRYRSRSELALRASSGASSLRRLVPQAKESGSVPAGTGDRKRDLRQTRIGLASPGETILQHRHPLHLPVPLASQHGADWASGLA